MGCLTQQDSQDTQQYSSQSTISQQTQDQLYQETFVYLPKHCYPNILTYEQNQQSQRKKIQSPQCNFNSLAWYNQNVSVSNHSLDNQEQCLIQVNDEEKNDQLAINYHNNLNINQSSSHYNRNINTQISSNDQRCFNNEINDVKASPFYQEQQFFEDQNEENLLNIDFLQNSQMIIQQKIPDSPINNQLQRKKNIFNENLTQPITSKTEQDKFVKLEFYSYQFQNSEIEIPESFFDNCEYQKKNYDNIDQSLIGQEFDNFINNLPQETTNNQNILPYNNQHQTSFQNTKINQNIFQYNYQLTEKKQKLPKQQKQQVQQRLQKKTIQKKNAKKRKQNHLGQDKCQETKNFATNTLVIFFDAIKKFYPQIQKLEKNNFQLFDAWLVQQIQTLPSIFKDNLLLFVDTELIRKAMQSKKSKTQYEIIKYLPGLKLMIQNPGKFDSIKHANEVAIQIYNNNFQQI
ncbi:hypothetical protein ABPG74_018216 [Tetrahymena malaccensis]